MTASTVLLGLPRDATAALAAAAAVTVVGLPLTVIVLGSMLIIAYFSQVTVGLAIGRTALPNGSKIAATSWSIAGS